MKVIETADNLNEHLHPIDFRIFQGKGGDFFTWEARIYDTKGEQRLGNPEERDNVLMFDVFPPYDLMVESLVEMYGLLPSRDKIPHTCLILSLFALVCTRSALTYTLTSSNLASQISANPPEA